MWLILSIIRPIIQYHSCILADLHVFFTDIVFPRPPAELSNANFLSSGSPTSPSTMVCNWLLKEIVFSPRVLVRRAKNYAHRRRGGSEMNDTTVQTCSQPDGIEFKCRSGDKQIPRSFGPRCSLLQTPN